MARERDDDFTDEPRRRRRGDDDEGYGEAPRRRRRDDDEDEPRPRRRRDDDDDDYDDIRRRIRRQPEQLTGIDGMFANTHIVMLVLFSCLCGGIALIFGVVGLIACRDAKARQNALIVTIISGLIVALGILARVAQSVK
jgi:hypothetical protein